MVMQEYILACTQTQIKPKDLHCLFHFRYFVLFFYFFIFFSNFVFFSNLILVAILSKFIHIKVPPDRLTYNAVPLQKLWYFRGYCCDGILQLRPTTCAVISVCHSSLIVLSQSLVILKGTLTCNCNT